MYNEEAFLNKHVPDWRRLEEMCARGSASTRAFSGNELVEFVRLYRQASGDLAYLMTHSSNAEVVVYLNNVVGKSYAVLYRTPTKRFADVVRSSLLAVAQTFRRRVAFFALSVAVFLVGAGYSYTMLSVRPESREYFVSPLEEENFAAWREGRFDPRTAGESTMMSGFYSSNNPRVAIMTVGVSTVSAGTLTTFILWRTGIQMGALSHDMVGVGHIGFLISSIMPHGASELTGMFIAGAAGYVLAWALVFPGRRKRLDAVREAGKDAFTLCMTSVAMMFIAAPIEGFFSFNPAVPQAAKVVFGLVALSAWGLFFFGYGRNADRETARGGAGTGSSAGRSRGALPGSATGPV
ncbi:MAG: stage II sporulation protein M [Fimbriimonadaceae bacterium]|nr:stage II sporulation protein M [Fimbriimonadaceae bacterium]